MIFVARYNHTQHASPLSLHSISTLEIHDTLKIVQMDRPQSSVSSNTSIGRPVAAVDAGVVTAENQPLTGAGLLKLLPLALAALLAAARSSIAWTVELTGERAPLGDDGQRLGRDGL